MRFGSLFTSVIFHIAIIAFMTVGIAFTPEREINIPPPITVEFAKMDELTQTPNPLPEPPAKKPEEEKKPEPPKKKEEKPKPKPAATNTSDVPVAPVKEPKKEEPKPPEQEAEVKPVPKPDLKKEEKKPDPPPETNKKEAEKSPEPKKEEEPKKEAKPQRDFGSVLKNLAETEPEDEAEIADQDVPAIGQQAPLGEQLTIGELDALRRQLEDCWNVPIGARDIENMVIDVNIVVGPDRVVQQAGIVDKSRYNSDSFFRAVADTAIRAVYSPSCSPLHLPEGKYEIWKNIIVEFNPKEMF